MAAPIATVGMPGINAMVFGDFLALLAENPLGIKVLSEPI